MNAAQILHEELVEAGVSFEVDGRRRLRLKADSAVLNPETLARIRKVKSQLVQVISLSRCSRCGSTEFTDHPIHGGQSARRDCASCGRCLGFSRWYGIDVVGEAVT